jgi:hypothetical protein
VCLCALSFYHFNPQVARDQAYREQLDAEEEDRIERLLEKRRLIQERLAARNQGRDDKAQQRSNVYFLSLE